MLLLFLSLSPVLLRLGLLRLKTRGEKPQSSTVPPLCLAASQGAYFRQEARVSFLVGCLAVLALLTAALLLLPMPPATPFDYDGLMAVFPLFR